MLVVLSLALASSEPGLRLEWRAPPECATADEVHARLVDAVATAPTADVRIAAVITREGDLLLLRIDRDTAAGHEHDEISSARCDVLVDVAVLLASIALDPAATRRERHDPPPVRGAVGLLASFDLGTLPRPTVGGGAQARVYGRWWSAALVAHHQHDQRVRDGGSPPLTAAVSWWGIGVRGCGTPGVGSVVFPLCAGPEVGGLRGQAEGSRVARTQVWAAISAGAGLVWSIAPRRLADALALVFDVSGVIALRRPGFHLAGRPTSIRAGSVALRIGLGLEGRFGRRAKSRSAR